MASIQIQFETSVSADKAKSFIDEELLSQPEITMMLQEHYWEGHTLHASGTLGEGTVQVADNEVAVDIELSMFGTAAKSRIEEALTDFFKRMRS